MAFAKRALWPERSVTPCAGGTPRALRQLDTATRITLVLMTAFVLSALWSEPAAAQAINLNPVTTFLSTIVTALTGTLGKTIATLALVGVCIGWFMGYIEMRLAIYVLIAIVFVGSAATIVNSLWTTTT